MLVCAGIKWMVYTDVSCTNAPSKRMYCDVNSTVNQYALNPVRSLKPGPHCKVTT